MEIIGYAAITLGGLIVLIGWIWLIVIGFKVGGPLWGVLIFFFSPLAALIFCIMNKTGWIPFALMIVGIFIELLGMIPIVLKIMENMDQMPAMG